MNDADPLIFCPGCGGPLSVDAGYLRGPRDPAGPRLYVVKRRCCMRQATGASSDPRAARAEAAANWLRLWGLSDAQSPGLFEDRPGPESPMR